MRHITFSKWPSVEGINHLALLYLMLKAPLIGNLARWTLLLHEFTLLYHLPTVQHEIVDYLTSLESVKASEGVRDDFPEDQLFNIFAVEPNDAPKGK